MLYYFSIILDPRLRLQMLYNILQLIGKNMNRDYLGTHYNLVSQYFSKVFKAYEEDNRIDETQSPLYVHVHAFELQVKHY